MIPIDASLHPHIIMLAITILMSENHLFQHL